MISEEKSLKILFFPHISEKTSSMKEKSNVVVFVVDKKSTKLDIKLAVKRLFSVDVHGVRVLNVKKKIKKGTKDISRRKVWKKAYVTLEHGKKIDFFVKLNHKKI